MKNSKGYFTNYEEAFPEEWYTWLISDNEAASDVKRNLEWLINSYSLRLELPNQAILLRLDEKINSLNSLFDKDAIGYALHYIRANGSKIMQVLQRDTVGKVKMHIENEAFENLTTFQDKLYTSYHLFIHWLIWIKASLNSLKKSNNKAGSPSNEIPSFDDLFFNHGDQNLVVRALAKYQTRERVTKICMAMADALLQANILKPKFNIDQIARAIGKKFFDKEFTHKRKLGNKERGISKSNPNPDNTYNDYYKEFYAFLKGNKQE